MSPKRIDRNRCFDCGGPLPANLYRFLRTVARFCDACYERRAAREARENEQAKAVERDYRKPRYGKLAIGAALLAAIMLGCGPADNGTDRVRLPVPQAIAFGAEPLPIVPVLYQVDPPAPEPTPTPASVPTVSLPDEISGNVGAFIAIRPETNGRIVKFIAAPGLNVFPADMLRDPTQTVVSAASAGRYALTAYTALGDVPSEPETCTVVVGNPPTPVPPTPPGPGPTPPPTPGTNGLSVLIVEEGEDRDELPRAQQQAIVSIEAGPLRNWLDAHCEKVGGQPNWRLFDDDVSAEFVSQFWREAMAMPRASLPWIVASNGKDAGVSQPLPADEAATLALLEGLAK